MERFITPGDLTTDVVLLPALFSAEQSELKEYLGRHKEDLCPLQTLAARIYDGKYPTADVDGYSGPAVCVTYQGGALRAREYDISLEASNLSLPDKAAVIVPGSKVSTAYLIAAIRAEMSQRQAKRVRFCSQFPWAPLSCLGELLLPRPQSPLGQQLLGQVLRSPKGHDTTTSPQILYLPPPFTEGEALANAVVITDTETLALTKIGPSHRFLFLEQLPGAEEAGTGNDEKPYPVILGIPDTANIELRPLSTTGKAIRPVVALLKGNERHIAWLNAPADVSVGDVPHISVGSHALLRVLREAILPAHERAGRLARVAPYFDRVLARAEIQVLLERSPEEEENNRASDPYSAVAAWLSERSEKDYLAAMPDIFAGENQVPAALWDLSLIRRYVAWSFSPFLVVALPGPPVGPGGVLLKPWIEPRAGFAKRYFSRLQENLARQGEELRKLRRRVADEIVGRIRHMFKNRIGGIRMDVRELRIAAERSPWQTDCAIDPEVALAMVKRKGFPPDHYHVGSYLTRVEKALDSLTQIVDRISQYYRSGAVQPTLVNVAEEVAEKVSTWKRDRQDVAVEERYDPLPAMVLIDRERFREVLDNLLTNCKEHLQVGDGHALEVTVQVRRDKVVVELSNSGPKEMPANPKEPYVTTSKTGGTGLGLAIVDRHVREAGGRFDFFAREAALGVTNRIELPNAHWELRGTADA